MRVLVACEFSGTVRRAFRERGHDAWSCDLEPAMDDAKEHFQGDILDVLRLSDYDGLGWDLMIAHPPCTYLTIAGARWMNEPGRAYHQIKAIQFVESLWNSNIPRIAIENPVGVLSTKWQRPSQMIHPWQYGHGERKQTSLWLKNLPKLQPTDLVQITSSRIHWIGPSKDRAKLRSIFYPGIAAAMADQWGCLNG